MTKEKVFMVTVGSYTIPVKCTEEEMKLQANWTNYYGQCLTYVELYLFSPEELETLHGFYAREAQEAK